MFKSGDRVRVLESEWDDAPVGSLGTVTEVDGDFVMTVVDGFEPTDLDVFFATITRSTIGSLPFKTFELALV